MLKRILLLCLPFCLAACAEQEKAVSLPEKKPEVIANEVVSIDLSKDDGPLTHRAAGFVRGIAIQDPADNLLLPLRPSFFRQPAIDAPPKYGALAVRDRTTAMGAKVHAVLSGGVGFDGAFPGDKGNWTRWEAGVERLVRQAGASQPRVVWEIWDEPNNSFAWKGSREQYYALWYRTVRKIRSIDPQAVIAGPSIDRWDQGWIEGFLKVTKDYQVMPDIVCWHERDIRPDIAGHLSGFENSEWQDGLGTRPKIAFHAVSDKLKFHPAIAVLFFAAVERAKVESAARKGWGEHGTQLANLLTADSEPRSTWWAYKAYADLIGRRAGLNKSNTVDGLAAWDAQRKAAQAILGRARTTLGTTQPATPARLGQVELRFTHVPAGRARVIARLLPTAAGQALDVPIETINAELPVTNQELRIVLPRFDDGDAYLVSLSDFQEAKPTTKAAATKP
jgi:hypothetical protein